MRADTSSGDAGFIPIKPATIDLTAASIAQDRKNTGRRFGKQPLLWFGVGAVILSVVIVFFLLLPRWVPTPVIDSDRVVIQTDAERTAARKSTSPPVTAATGTADAPWEKAQRSALRRESQEILGQMLELQKTLEEKGVTTWAGKEYDQAIQHARAGDAEYSRQNFSQAHDQYARALGIFTGLLHGMEELFNGTMEAGNTALFEGDSARAREAFKIALAIDPIDRAALLGMERAGTLDEVTGLVDKGDALLRDGKAEEAKVVYKQALDIDSHSDRAQQQLRSAESQIIEREFNLAMSSGFRSLEQNRYKQAQDSFNRALKLKPRSRDARSGLEQAGHRIKSARLNSLLEQAKEAEANEDWQQAVSGYEAALSLDSNLANALEGKNRASLRNEIHNRLEQALAHPARLFDHAVFNEVVSFRDKIRLLSDPGPVMTGQLSKLTRLLVIADTPLQVQLLSDNLTRVTLYKIGELGFFTSKNLSLRPGRYIAVGHRDGYRDVRVEFFVDPDKSMEPVVVRSAEKIALGR